MKKFLLSLMFLASFAGAKAQLEVVLNEIYPSPSQNPTVNEEYVELYNTTAVPINLDCYTLVSYYTTGTGGAWVYQLPNVTIAPFSHVVFASALPIDYQGVNSPYNGPNAYSWNNAGAGTFSSLTNHTRTGNALGAGVAGTTLDFIPITGGNTANMQLMLFDGTGALVNAFFANNSGNIPTYILNLSDLNIPILADAGSGCAANASLKFSQISAPEAETFTLNQATGNDNGYFRERDGLCGTWDKSATASDNTPGVTNSNLPPIDGSSIIDVQFSTPAQCTFPNTTYNVSIVVTNDPSITVFPISYQVYYDRNGNATLDAGDSPAIASGQSPTSPVQLNGLVIPTNTTLFVQVNTAAGCVQAREEILKVCSTLPVNFSAFTANRNRSNVLLRWETSFEENSDGFAVERNVNGTWTEIAYVPSQAPNGNSVGRLMYTYNDVNNVKGITEYRIRQVDFNGTYKFSQVRAVRGEGQVGKTIVYPNPSSDGKVKVVFEDGSVSRDVTVTDMAGRVVRQFRNVTNNNLQIDNLTAGMFTIRIVVPETGEQTVEKVVVNKR